MRGILAVLLFVVLAGPALAQDEEFAAKMKAAPQYSQAVEIITALRKVDDVDTRVVMLKRLDGLVSTLTQTYYLAAADVLNDEVEAIGRTLRLAAGRKDPRTRVLYDQYLNAYDGYISLTEIQGTGHGENMAYCRQRAIPYLALVDMLKARAEARTAAHQINTYTFEARIYLDIVSEQATRDRPQLSAAALHQLLQWAAQCVDGSRKSGLHVESSWKDVRDYLTLCRILVDGMSRPFERNARLIDQYMLGTNLAYAPIFPFDAFAGSVKLTGLTDLVDAMKAFDPQKAVRYARQTLIPRLDHMRYAYLPDLQSARNHYPYSDLEVANKIYTLVYFSSLFDSTDPALARRLALDAVALLPAFEAQKSSALFQREADVLCLTRLLRFDEPRARALAARYRVDISRP